MQQVITQSLRAWELIPAKSPVRGYLVTNEENHLQQKRKGMLSRQTEILEQIVDGKLLGKYTKSGTKSVYSSKNKHHRESFNTQNYTVQMNDNWRIILSRKNAVVGNKTREVSL